MTAPATLLVAVDARPSRDDRQQDAHRPERPAGTFSDRNHFPAPRGRVVATRPPDGAPTLADVIADYMAEEWGEGA